MAFSATITAPTLTWNGQTPPGAAWPADLAPGATIGFFAPAHHFDRGEMLRGAARLRSWGFEVKIPGELSRRRHYLAGTDEHRLAIVTELMEDDRVDGLMAVRGGYGCQRLLPALAPLWKKWPPKPIFGFSDLTALHLARFQASGVLGFHSPMAVSLGKESPAKMVDRLSQSDLRRVLTTSGRSGGWTFAARDALKPGRAVGPLLGGNLTLVTALLASPWLPDMSGAILLLEEVDEAPYRLDRLLTTLRQSPVWRQAAGLVFGRFTKCGSPAEVGRLLREAADGFNGPVLRNAPFSHGRRNRLFPVGAMAELTVP